MHFPYTFNRSKPKLGRFKDTRCSQHCPEDARRPDLAAARAPPDPRMAAAPKNLLGMGWEKAGAEQALDANGNTQLATSLLDGSMPMMVDPALYSDSSNESVAVDDLFEHDNDLERNFEDDPGFAGFADPMAGRARLWTPGAEPLDEPTRFSMSLAPNDTAAATASAAEPMEEECAAVRRAHGCIAADPQSFVAMVNIGVRPMEETHAVSGGGIPDDVMRMMFTMILAATKKPKDRMDGGMHCRAHVHITAPQGDEVAGTDRMMLSILACSGDLDVQDEMVDYIDIDLRDLPTAKTAKMKKNGARSNGGLFQVWHEHPESAELPAAYFPIVVSMQGKIEGSFRNMQRQTLAGPPNAGRRSPVTFEHGFRCELKLSRQHEGHRPHSLSCETWYQSRAEAATKTTGYIGPGVLVSSRRDAAGQPGFAMASRLPKSSAAKRRKPSPPTGGGGAQLPAATEAATPAATPMAGGYRRPFLMTGAPPTPAMFTKFEQEESRSALQDLTMENHPAAVAGFGPSSLDFSLSGNENQYPAGPVFPDVKSETF